MARKRSARSPRKKAPKAAPKAPKAAPKAPKVPARFHAIGGVDPRALPGGVPYPCNDPYVGEKVSGDRFAGQILGCATPPEGKRGAHFVVGGLASGAQIGAAWRASARNAEKVRARYEGPDFDARPARRARGVTAPAPRPMLALPAPAAPPRPRRALPVLQPTRRPRELAGPAWNAPAPARKALGFGAGSPEPHRDTIQVTPNDIPTRLVKVSIPVRRSSDIRRVRKYRMPNGEVAAVGWFVDAGNAHTGPTLVDESDYGRSHMDLSVAPVVTDHVLRELRALTGKTPKVEDVTSAFTILATRAPVAYDGHGTFGIATGYVPPVWRDVDTGPWRVVATLDRNADWQRNRYGSGSYASVETTLDDVRAFFEGRTASPKSRVLGFGAGSAETLRASRLEAAIAAQLEARLGQAPSRVLYGIKNAILDGNYNETLAPASKHSRAVFSFLTGVKLPSTEKGTRLLFAGKRFTLIPASRWFEGTDASSQIARADSAWREVLAWMRKRFGPDHFQTDTFPPGAPRPELPNVPGAIAAMGATDPQHWRGMVSPLRLYVAQVTNPKGEHLPKQAVAFLVFADNPAHPSGLFGGPATLLPPDDWKQILGDYLKKHGVGA